MGHLISKIDVRENIDKRDIMNIPLCRDIFLPPINHLILLKPGSKNKKLIPGTHPAP